MRTNYWIWVIAVACLSACRTEPDNLKRFDELVVSTNYDDQANFNVYTTFALPKDTIGFVSNAQNDTILTSSESSLPRPVLDAIRSNLKARGYTEVKRTENPDVGINVLVVNDFNVFQEVVYPNYYGGYYGYSSYYYYPYINTYAYNTGLLVIEMVDLKNKTLDNKVKVVWDAYLGDVYSTIKLVDQSVAGVNQAFLQSPYLDK